MSRVGSGGAILLMIVAVTTPWGSAAAAALPRDVAAQNRALGIASLDPSDGELGACPFYRAPLDARDPRQAVRAAVSVRTTLVIVLSIYGGVAALWALVLLRWKFPKRLPYEMPVLVALAAATLVALAARWSDTDALATTRVIVTDPDGNGIERTQISVDTLRRRKVHLVVPHPKSALRLWEGFPLFGSPLRMNVARTVIERDTVDQVVIGGVAPIVYVAAPLATAAVVPRLKIRDGKPWIVNPTGSAYTAVEVCLGRPPIRRFEAARSSWGLRADLPAGEERELEARWDGLGQRSPCDYTRVGNYQIEAVVVSPGDVSVRTAPPLPARNRIVSIVRGAMPGVVAGR